MEQNRHPRILVVEDDPLVRELLVDILREAAFEVQEAGCASEAIRHLAAHACDAVLSDIDMPGGLGGIGLARHIGTTWPEIGVILISGHSRPILPSGIPFLAKPFTATRLLSAVVGAIGRPVCVSS